MNRTHRTYLPPVSDEQIESAFGAAAYVSNLSREQLQERTHAWNIVQARSLAWLLLRLATGAPYKTLSRLLGYEQTSIMHGCRKTIELMAIYPDMRRLYDAAVTEYWTLMDAKEPGNIPREKSG